METKFARLGLTASIAVATVATQGVAQTGPVTHLRFDDAANLGADTSGNGNDAGVNAGPGYTAAGIAGGAADLTGNNGFFNFLGEDDPVEGTLEAAFSYSIWVNTTQVFGSNGDAAFSGAGIIYADVPGSPPGPAADSIPMALTGSKLGGFFGADDTVRSASNINTGDWVHLVATRDPNGESRYYVNGVLEDARPAAFSGDLSARNELVIGGNTSDGRYLSGLIDDFQAYDRVLSPTDIVFLFDNPGGEVVPEPAAGALLIGGFGLLGLRRRRA